MSEQNHTNCRCWTCFIQDNFTSVSLMFVVLVGLTLMVVLMHEQKIDDKYVTWFEGFVAGGFSAWTLALKGAPIDKPHELAPGTTEATLRVEPPMPPMPPMPPTGTIPVEVPVVPNEQEKKTS
jgi:hypothetical protein